MYPDNTLTPKEATRLCMLGTLAHGDSTYAEVARSVRTFTGALLGPSLDLLASAIELLRLEGLVEFAEPDTDDRDETPLHITEAGRAELTSLLKAPIRENGGEYNRLIVALKIRFLHVLETEDRCEQIDELLDAADAEIGRLDSLKSEHEADSELFTAWLAHERASVDSRTKWLKKIRTSL